MSTVYASTRRRRFRHRRPTFWDAVIEQFRYVIRVGM